MLHIVAHRNLQSKELCQKYAREEDNPMFVAPEMKVVEFDVVDVITTSDICADFEGAEDQLPAF